MKRRAGFTLIELLVVVSIIALLVAMLLPTLGRAKALAKKAACSSNMDNYGLAVALYVTEYESYPHFGPSNVGIVGFSNMWGWGFPKFYGVMHANRIRGTHRTNLGTDAYFWDIDEMWDGAVCPGMNALQIWQMAEAAYDAGRVSYDGKAAMHKAAAGYQWNPTLRAKPAWGGRWDSSLVAAGDIEDNTQWIDWVLHLPAGAYGAQAIRPEEVAEPQVIAEAWDSWDYGAAPNVGIQSSWRVECMVPGWHVGPQSDGTNGWALLNAIRHPGGPNILYAGGQVASDATRPVQASDLGACPSGSWDGIQAVSWSDPMENFGTMWHICPQRKFRVPLTP